MKSGALSGVLRDDPGHDIIEVLNLEDTPEHPAPSRLRDGEAPFLHHSFSLQNSVLVTRIAQLTAGAAPKRIDNLDHEQIIFVSGVHHVRTEWGQIQIQPGTETEDRSAQADPRTPEAGSISPYQTTVGVGMNTPLLSSPLSAPIPGAIKKKRVLLIDTSHEKRDLRAEVLRKLGMDVDCAADIAEARSWWRPALYDLVLMDVDKGRGQRDKFCDDLRSATPPQRLAYLVGQPAYLADSPNTNEELPAENGDEQTAIRSMNGAFPVDPGDATQRWGILEASRKISAVRAASIARTLAMRALPPPPRDSEGRPAKPTATPTSLDDLLKEELR